MDKLNETSKIPKSSKNIYGFPEFYRVLYWGMRTMPAMIKNRKTKEIDDNFIERIMFSVTEVNGCPVCSYAHTKWALEQGMSNKEINLLLAGSAESVPSEQLVAVLFAQHYADTRGNPETKTWQRVVEVYGKSKALIILGATRAIMIGNIWGIAYSSFANRLKRKPSGKTSLLYELGIMVSIIPLLPAALIHAQISRIKGKDVITFLKTQDKETDWSNTIE